MELLFRKLEETNVRELEQLNELMGQLIEQAVDLDKLAAIVKNYNAREDAYLMVAEDKETGRICGSLLAVMIEDYCGACKPLLLIENVVTHRDYHHKGVGTRMFEAIETWGKERNVNYALLCSDMEREGAHAFYRAIGCKEVKGFKKYF